MFKHIVLISLIIACIFISVPAVAQKLVKIEPNLEPGKVYSAVEIPEAWYIGSVFSFGIKGATIRTAWGKNFMIHRAIIGPASNFSIPYEIEESLVYVIKGPLTFSEGDKNTVLHDSDCVFFGKYPWRQITTDLDTAEFLLVTWPVIPKFVSMKLMQANAPIPDAIPPSSEPSEAFGEVIRISRLGMITIAKNVLGRLVQGNRGQICDMVLLKNAVYPSLEASGEEFLFVLQGTLEKNIGGKTVTMKEGDAMYIPKGMLHGAKAGSYGCRIMSIISPARTEYAKAFEEQGKKLELIVSPGVKPKVLIENWQIYAAEGPSWMNGKLYFSSQRYGIHVLNSDGTYKLITKDLRTCGTAPLPNDNLAVCDQTQFRVIELSPEGDIVKVLADSNSGLPDGYPNDLTVDAKGGIYVTVNDLSGKFQKSNVVVYINPKGKVLRLTDYQDIDYPNGIALSPDGSRLFVGSNETVVWMFDIQQADGTITSKRPFANINLELYNIGKSGAISKADGMKFDSDGNLYITSQTGIQVFDKAGGYIGTILIPTFASNLDFGGDDLKTLYITGGQNIYTLKVNVPGQ